MVAQLAIIMTHRHWRQLYLVLRKPSSATLGWQSVIWIKLYWNLWDKTLDWNSIFSQIKLKLDLNVLDTWWNISNLFEYVRANCIQKSPGFEKAKLRNFGMTIGDTYQIILEIRLIKHLKLNWNLKKSLKYKIKIRLKWFGHLVKQIKIILFKNLKIRETSWFKLD